MRNVIIGDVHGMLPELERLLELLALEENDRIIFVGDLVDKGPDSAGVVRCVRELAEKHRVVLVEGNHEEKHRRFRRHLAADNGIAEKMKGTEEMRAITEAMSAEDIAFLEKAIPFYRIRNKSVLIIHGGIPGDMTEFPETPEALTAFSSKKRKSFGKTLRTRYVSAETGKFIALGDHTECDPFWAEIYDGRFGYVVFGHEPFIGPVPKQFPHAVGIDGGCVFGGSLIAIIYHSPNRFWGEDTPPYIISVLGRKMAEPFQK